MRWKWWKGSWAHLTGLQAGSHCCTTISDIMPYNWQLSERIPNDNSLTSSQWVSNCLGTALFVLKAHKSAGLPPLLPPPLVPVCLVLALRPPAALCWPLLWLREVEFGLEMVFNSCSMEHRSAIRASRSTVSPWFNASARSKAGVIAKERVILISASLFCCYTEVRSYHLCYTLRSGRKSWPCSSPAWEEVSAVLSAACHHPDSAMCAHTRNS